ncbi:MAG: fused MFS/spermidine synthase [Holophagaceae bacterium]|nr:fused MFS/spermidine synthase [Holophagaceae bacterium]
MPSTPRPSRLARWLLYSLFLFSGATALAYEILWTRQLSLLVGATTPALSVVLAVFMGGLALGAWAFGRVADRSPNLLRCYAAMEWGIGLFALVQPTLLAWIGKGYLGAVHVLGSQGQGLMAARLLCAALLLLIPTMLMGGTLPVLLRFLSRRKLQLGADLSGLYSVNLLGAVLGSFLTGFVLIRTVGLHGTLVLAVSANLLVGLIAWLWKAEGLALPEGGLAEPPVAPEAAPAPISTWALLAAAAVSGFLTMGYQVAWTRMLVFSFGSTVYTFTLTLIAFLLGLALGGALFPRLERRFGARGLLGGSQVLAAVGALALAPLVALLPAWLNWAGVQWGYSGRVQLGGTMAGACLVMLGPVTLMGVVFPLVVKSLIPDLARAGRTVGRVYWINTAGSICGALATGFLLIPFLSLKGCLAALAGVQALVGLAFLAGAGSPAGAIRFRAGVLLGAGLFGGAAWGYFRALPGANPFDRMGYMNGTAVSVLAHHDDPAGSVTVTRSANGVVSLRINGFEATADAAEGAYMPMMSHLPILLHGGACKTLVICFGTGSTAGSVLLHPGATVDAVDINPTVLAVAPRFNHVNHGVFRDPRARMLLDDGRSFLLTAEARYDVITSEPMPPTHAGVVNLYSQEYYRLARERLNPGGLLVQWLPFHLVSHGEAQGILRTVQEVFPETTLWVHDDTGLIVASKDRPVRLDAGLLAAAYANSEVAGDLARLQVPTPEAFLQLYALGPAEVRAFTGDIPVISDDRPSLEFHVPRHRASLVIGGYDPEEAKALTSVYALRALAQPPVTGLEGLELDLWTARFQMRSAVLQGQLALGLRHPREARVHFEAALRGAPDADARALCCYLLANAARVQGDLSAARTWIERCLGEKPTSAMALKFREQLAAPTPK